VSEPNKPSREQVLGNLSTSLLSWGIANEPGKPKRRAKEATERAVAAVRRASERLKADLPLLAETEKMKGGKA